MGRWRGILKRGGCLAEAEQRIAVGGNTFLDSAAQGDLHEGVLDAEAGFAVVGTQARVGAVTVQDATLDAIAQTEL